MLLRFHLIPGVRNFVGFYQSSAVIYEALKHSFAWRLKRGYLSRNPWFISEQTYDNNSLVGRPLGITDNVNFFEVVNFKIQR